jgi:hypothetical protein
VGLSCLGKGERLRLLALIKSCWVCQKFRKTLVRKYFKLIFMQKKVKLNKKLKFIYFKAKTNFEILRKYEVRGSILSEN